MSRTAAAIRAVRLSNRPLRTARVIRKVEELKSSVPDPPENPGKRFDENRSVVVAVMKDNNRTRMEMIVHTTDQLFRAVFQKILG